MVAMLGLRDGTAASRPSRVRLSVSEISGSVEAACGLGLADAVVDLVETGTTMPGMQIFTANHFTNKKGKGGALYQAQQGVCFETQFYPDTPNQAHFTSVTLKADNEFYAVTEYEVLF